MWKTLWKLVVRTRADGCTGLAGMIAYNFFLAIPTFLIFMATILAYLPIDNLAGQIIDQLRNVLPNDALSVLNRVLTLTLQRENNSLVVPLLSLLGTLYVMNNGYAGLIGSLNRIFDFDEQRPWLRVRLRALVMSIIAGGLLIAAFTMVLIAPRIVSALSEDEGLNLTIGLWLGRLRWPAILALALIGMESTYRYAPCGRLKFGILSPGTLFATGSWLVATLGFGFYVNHYSSYQTAYGSLGSVIVFMTWIWISAMIFLLGAEINVMWEAWREGKVIHAARSEEALPKLPEIRIGKE